LFISLPHANYELFGMPTSFPSTIQLENGLTATLRSSGDPSLNAVKDKLFCEGDKTPLEYCCVASVKFEDETMHLLLWTCTSQDYFNQVLRELQTDLSAVPNHSMFVGLGYEVNQQVHLYFWNKKNNPRSKDTKAAKILWKALMNKTKPSIQMLLCGLAEKPHVKM
jgi:hypothetical protein